MPRIQHYEANPSAVQIAGAGWLLSGQALETGTPPINDYFSPTAAIAGTSVTLGNGNLRAMPLWIPQAMTVDRIGAETTLGGDAGCVVRLGVYAHDAATNRPTTLLLDAGTIPGDVIAVSVITISLALARGTYWIACAVQGVTVVQPTVRISGFFHQIASHPAAASVTQSGCGWVRTGVTGALPSPMAPTGLHGTAPRLILRRAA